MLRGEGIAIMTETRRWIASDSDARGLLGQVFSDDEDPMGLWVVRDAHRTGLSVIGRNFADIGWDGMADRGYLYTITN